MAGYLTTHALDTAAGRPAAGLAVTLCRIDGEARTPLRRMTTNADGRTDEPILPETLFAEGAYELVFEVGAYLRAQGLSDVFFETVPIRFRMMEAAHYHVPLLLSPFGYSTYRGS